VTFLLADIEDSTGLLRQLGPRYAGLLADVRRILRAAVREAGGQPVDIRADELFAVFKQAPSALEAAVAIQRALLSRTWRNGAEVRVRLGLHTGRPSLTDTGYVGLAVHLAARVCSAAHGGQIVMSHFARDAVLGRQPPGISFRDLGQHRLRGLPEPVRLYQAEADGLPADFPPPRVEEASAGLRNGS